MMRFCCSSAAENVPTQRLLQHNEASNGGILTCKEAHTRYRIAQDHTVDKRPQYTTFYAPDYQSGAPDY
ncbi:hypothetical protein EPI10_027205 [Gossypium australe]|uniref:Uncharacterized protein n=1 Tax=Gossypium australe TaxID=47621 RepID=A0A5B6UR72_9ROSI|nr:hypothetical protein EPI10_027205 [Gossypium australe]